MHNYKNLHIWKESIKLAQKIYELTSTFPANEKYGIVSQMTRAAVSIPSNIAEGSGRSTPKEFANFLSIALGSLFELHTQIVICEQIGYFETETVKQLEIQTYSLQQQISAFKQRISNSEAILQRSGPTAKRSYNEVVNVE